MKLDHANISLDGRLGVLADARRRMVLRFLSDQPDNVSSIDEVGRYLDSKGGWTNSERGQTPEQLEIELQHRQFPKIADAGLSEYDVRGGRVRYCPDEATERLLDFMATL